MTLSNFQFNTTPGLRFGSGLARSSCKEIIDKLGIKPTDLLRKGEKDFKENFKGKSLTDEEWLEAMVQYPKLIERPIVVKGDKAVLGRPPENVKILL